MTEQITPEYLSFATEHHASDIFIIAGRPLSFKINGKLSIYGERLMPADTEILLRQIYQMSNNRNFDRFLEIGDDDFSFSIPRLSRFRVNTYRQRGSLAAVIRVIAFELPDPGILNIPEDVMSVSDFTKGMVLVTGPAGSDNSINLMNFIVPDHVSYCRIQTHNFKDRDSVPVYIRDKLLGNYCLQYHG